jgi:hypothetical protein
VNEANLVARHNGNASALKHGVHARAELLAPEIAERVADLADLPWATTADRVALEEVGRLLVLIDRLDADLDKRGVTRTKTLPDRTEGLALFAAVGEPDLPVPDRSFGAGLLVDVAADCAALTLCLHGSFSFRVAPPEFALAGALM